MKVEEVGTSVVEQEEVNDTKLDDLPEEPEEEEAPLTKEEFLDALKDLDSLMDNLSPDQEDTESESGETQEEV